MAKEVKLMVLKRGGQSSGCTEDDVVKVEEENRRDMLSAMRVCNAVNQGVVRGVTCKPFVNHS